MTLWAGTAGDPKQLAQAKTADDGSFAFSADETPAPGESLYLIAKGGAALLNKSGGDNPARDRAAARLNLSVDANSGFSPRRRHRRRDRGATIRQASAAMFAIPPPGHSALG